MKKNNRLSHIYDRFCEILNERILVLDGGMGTMIQQYNLTEADYRGRHFARHTGQLRGNNDLLCITQPEIIQDIHRQYLDAGADIFSTNTLNANAISMEDYNMQAFVREMNLAAGQLARQLADQYMATHAGRTVFAAGSIGPTNKTASMSPDVERPAYRAVTYRDLYNAYAEQIAALIDGGIDILLVETVFDTLNAKAASDAAMQVMAEKNIKLPIMLSLTLQDGGRSLSGQTLEAFLASVQHIPVVSVGLNCSFGAAEMKPYLKTLSELAPCYVSAYPNAGLPDNTGQYTETPETMAMHIRAYIDEGLVNIVGGCCGTTPAHIAHYPAIVNGFTPRHPKQQPDCLWLSGLELLEVKPENNFINIGERCNVAGSRKFLRLIKEKKYEEALIIARKQVEDGAQVIDINMDDGLLDATEEMTTFLNLIASEPDISRVPVMIDSSKWEVIESALQCIQGKSIVNSISLKEGETTFLAHAAAIRRYGAAAVVMAFDEEGQADTYERKIAICQRAYHLLTEKADFPPHDIIFDPNILAIATGMAEHNGYGLNFIRAVTWIKQHLPGAKVSGGVSNLSFSFRGNNYLRESMHAVFLYHAIREGMDMGIVNPSTSVNYEDIDPALRTLIEDAVLARHPDAAETLITYAQEHTQQDVAKQQETAKDAWRSLTLNERLEYALVRGVGDYLEEDIREALQVYDRAVAIIDGPLMNGMNKAGELFGAGKMFLPQVVKTARTMKKAVALLQPVIETEKTTEATSKAGKIVFATVRGDVHDIGKNIVSIVLACNNYEIIDLGVMVPADEIIRTVEREKPDILCLSGLITPSLDEMVHVAKEMQKAGQRIPIMVGGATTSKIYTALKIAPHYNHPVVHGTDASQSPLLAAKLINPNTHDLFVTELNEEYEHLRNIAGTHKKELLTLQQARAQRLQIDWDAYVPPVPADTDIHDLIIPIETAAKYINWTFFFVAWRMSGRYAELTTLHDCPSCRTTWLTKLPSEERDKATEAIKLFDDARELLQQLIAGGAYHCKARFGIFPATADGDNIRVANETFPMLRQQTSTNGVCLSLADYLIPASAGRMDYLGAFAVTAGQELSICKAQYVPDGDDYRILLLQTLTDRLAEAATEYLHFILRTKYWNYVPDENLAVDDLLKNKYRGIRPAIGYPSLPDQQLIFLLDKLIQLDRLGVSITENGAMTPLASVAGLFFAHPQAQYFMIGHISDEQLHDYAVRRRIPAESLRKFLVKNIDE